MKFMKILTIVFLVLLMGTMFPQAGGNVGSTSAQWEVPINVTDGVQSIVLTIGINPNGTDGFDPGLDQLAPPPPPPGAFDARLIFPYPVGEAYFTDIRDDSPVEKSYYMSYVPSAGNGPIVLSWDNTALPALGTFIIVDNILGNLFTLDMATTNSLTVTSPFILQNLRIKVTPIATVPPTADFSGTPTSGFEPLTVTFSDLSTPGSGTINSWSWDFGDGNTSTDQNPVHTYNSAGTYTVSLTVGDDQGQSDTETKVDYITVNPVVPPTADFSGTPTVGFEPLTVNFSDLSTAGTGTINSWSWDFGDGNSSTDQNPVHTYNSAGTYTVTLTVMDDLGQSDTETKVDYITVNPVIPPTADFMGTPTSGLEPLTVNFTDQSTAGTGTINSWSWDFGDGNSSTDQNPVHTYNSAGTYTVTLTVMDDLGQSDTETKVDYITVNPVIPPTADFMGTPTSGVEPLTVNFTDQSTAGTGTINSWSWDFGDGNSSTDQNPVHTYNAAGIYTVSLTVTDDLGSSDTETKIDYITVTSPSGPTANFVGVPTSGNAPVTVNFSDLSIPGTGIITSWSWDFGDGATSTEQNPTHTYINPGLYTVSLTVTDDNSLSDTETKTNYINVGSGAGSLWEVDFTVSDDAPGDNSIILTIGLHPNATDGFDVGIDVPAPPPPPSGAFDARLTWNNEDYFKDMRDTSAVEKNFVMEYIPQAGLGPIVINWDNIGGLPAGWDFVIVDNITGGLFGPLDMRSVGTLVVTDPTILTSLRIIVNPAGPILGPNADFTGTPTSGLEPLTVNFTDQSTPGTGTIVSWLWDFGDGNTSTDQNPVHVYNNPGTYTVSLTVTDDNSLSDTETKVDYITVNPLVGPTADFVGTPTSGVVPLTVNFTDQSTAGTGAIVSWMWDFGDGNTSTDQNPVHVYNAVGLYTVSLTVIDDNQLSDTETKTEYINVTQFVDNEAPSCDIGNIDPGPPLTITVVVQDTGSGLAAVNVLQQTNATVTIDPFQPGTNNPVNVVLTKVEQSSSAFVLLEIVDVAGNATQCDPAYTVLSAITPNGFALSQNFPNPFNPTTELHFDIPATDNSVMDVSIKVYDLTGREIKTLINEPMQPGRYSVKWDGTNNRGISVAGGVYIYRMVAGDFVQTRKMVLMK